MCERDIKFAVGTYTVLGGEGVLIYSLNPRTLQTECLGRQRVENPSFLCASPSGGHVYAVNESGSRSGVHHLAVDEMVRSQRAKPWLRVPTLATFCGSALAPCASAITAAVRWNCSTLLPMVRCWHLPKRSLSTSAAHRHASRAATFISAPSRPTVNISLPMIWVATVFIF